MFFLNVFTDRSEYSDVKEHDTYQTHNPKGGYNYNMNIIFIRLFGELAGA